MQWLIAICVLMVASPALAAPKPVYWEPELRRADCALKVGPVTAEGHCSVRVGVSPTGMLRGLKFPPQPAAIATGKADVTDPALATIVSIRLTVWPLPGTILAPWDDGSRSDTTLPVGGWLTYCLLVPGCMNYLRIPLYKDDNNAVGIGGLITVNGFDRSGVRLSLQAVPWNLGLLVCGGDTLRGIGTPANGVDPISVATGGVQRQVTCTTLKADSSQGPVQSRKFKGWRTIRFIPEPGVNLLLLAGVLGLCVLGRGRMRSDG